MPVRGSKKASEWAGMLADRSSGLYRVLGGLYGQDRQVLAERAAVCRKALDAFAAAYGENAEAVVVRTTGRVNLLGMHVDHRGGFTNPIAVKELFLVAQPRDDDRVVLRNVESDRFPDDSFVISEELPEARIDDWDAWTQAQAEQRTRAGTVGHWSNYVKAAVLYLQHLNTAADGKFSPPLRGMDVVVYGTIPAAAGLSSSSALVVAAAEACVRINALAMTDMELVDMCATAEWYVGTRGGGGDHMAIKFGRLDHIMHVGSFPFSVDWLPFPAEYSIVLANSLEKAEKSAGGRDIFNQRVASYVFGLMLARKNFPEFASKLEHLRDLNPDTLGTDEAQVYRMIRSLPERAGREEVREMLGDQAEAVQRTFASHAEPKDGYAIRQVSLYGVSECIRSGMAEGLLKDGDVEGFGQLINVSHDGDRVARLVDGQRVRCENAVPDAKLDQLMADLQSGEPGRVERARLWCQPGGYAVSTEELDILVDIARAARGVVGAGLVGAGLGGSIVAVVEKEHAAGLIEQFAREYYDPRGLPVAAEVVRPVGGACVLEAE
ncbi:MAG: hypothetical protein KAX44_06315 [Candidatus Brocadiae bacterium]|nr:hypothetical protein [Candidatus Brocadiia bacterium]